jgi:hypothetical protein
MRDKKIENKRTKKKRVDNGVHPSWAISPGPLPNNEASL